MTSTEETEHCEGCGNDDGPSWCEGAFTDLWLKFMKAALRESTRDEAIRILSTFTLDDLFGLIYVETWIDAVVRQRIRDYQNGVVQRHDAGRNDHD